MDSIVASARVNTRPMYNNDSNKQHKSHNSALSYSSSSGYSTQSLSELDYQSSKNNLATNKYDNTSQFVDNTHFSRSTNYSQASSQVSINHPSNLNILNPTTLLSSTTNVTNSQLSYIRTSTPTNPINSTTFQNSNHCSNYQYREQVRSNPTFNDRINFNPTCNSSIQSQTKNNYAKRIEYDSEYSLKATPPSSIHSRDLNSISNIRPHMIPVEYNLTTPQHQRLRCHEREQREKWSSPASKFITYVVKLFSCFNIFSIIKKENRNQEKQTRRRASKSNHSVIEMYKANIEKQSAQKYDNLNGSFIDTESNYLRFTNDKNHVSSTPVDSISRTKPIVSIVSKTQNSPIKFPSNGEETYDNVPSTFSPKNRTQEFSVSSNFCNSLTSFSTMNSTPVGNTNIEKYSICVKSPIYESREEYASKINPIIAGSAESISTVSSISNNNSGNSQMSNTNDYFMSIIELKKRPVIVTNKNSDFVQPGQGKNHLKVIESSKFIEIKRREIGQKIRPRPVYEDVLCDKEVESYFVPPAPQFVSAPKTQQLNFMKSMNYNQRVIHNKGFQNVKLASTKIGGYNGLIGAGLVRQTHGESYC